MTCLETGNEIVSLIGSVYKKFQIIDTSFPLLSFYWIHDDVVGVINNDSPSRALNMSFFARFRQAGGLRPIPMVTEILSDESADQQEISEPDVTRILAVRLSDGIADFKGILKPNLDAATLIYCTDDEILPARLASLAELPTGLLMRLRRNDVVESFYLSPTQGSEPAMIALVLQAAEAFAISVSVDAPSDARPFHMVRIDLPARNLQAAQIAINPKRFIHDGSRLVETSEDYSWLWVGAERHLRILLGAVPRHFRKLRIIVPNSHTSLNWADVKVLLNGVIVAGRVEKWSERSGAVSIDLTPSRMEQVLGFSVPFCEPIGDDGAMLAACIDRIELFS